jgi:hypothetical protein
MIALNGFNRKVARLSPQSLIDRIAMLLRSQRHGDAVQPGANPTTFEITATTPG